MATCSNLPVLWLIPPIERKRENMKTNDWHRVTPEDQQRIVCQFAKCGKPAEVCEHAQWNTGDTTGISFWYYCMGHGKESGFKGVAT